MTTLSQLGIRPFAYYGGVRKIEIKIYHFTDFKNMIELSSEDTVPMLDFQDLFLTQTRHYPYPASPQFLLMTILFTAPVNLLVES